MLTDFERRKIENDLVRQETRFSLRMSFGILLLVFVCGAIARMLKTDPYPPERLMSAWQLTNVVAIVMIIIVLAVRKTIYFSRRLIHDEFKLVNILRIWRRIDLWLMICPVLTALVGVIIAWMGMPFDHTFHFFIAAFLLTMILMPIPWKVKDKIRYFEKFVGRWNE